MYDDRTNLARQVADDLRDFFGKEGTYNGDPQKYPARRSSQLR